MHTRSKFAGQALTIEYHLRKDLTHPRLGITITRQYGKAHERNLFKRRVKEIFRNLTQNLDLGLDLNVRPKVNGASYDLLIQEFQRFLNSLKSL